MLTKLPYQPARLTFHGDAVHETRGTKTVGTHDDSGGALKNGGDTAGEIQDTDNGTTTGT
jgi:hypothetical protein